MEKLLAEASENEKRTVWTHAKADDQICLSLGQEKVVVSGQARPSILYKIYSEILREIKTCVHFVFSTLFVKFGGADVNAAARSVAEIRRAGG